MHPFSIIMGLIGLLAGLALRSVYGEADSLQWDAAAVMLSVAFYSYGATLSILFMTLPLILCSIIAAGSEGAFVYIWAGAGIVLNVFHVFMHHLAVRFAHSKGAEYANFVNLILGKQEKEHLK